MTGPVISVSLWAARISMPSNAAAYRGPISPSTVIR